MRAVKPEEKRVGYIDGLRALAVLSVLVFHSALSNPVAAAKGGVIALVFTQGCHGVDLFFVISGFCLSYPVLKKVYERGSYQFDLCGYLARRVIRIVPPYYAAIARPGTVLLVDFLTYPGTPRYVSICGVFR